MSKLKELITKNKILIFSSLVLIILIGSISALIVVSISTMDDETEASDVYIEITNDEENAKTEISSKGTYSFNGDILKFHIIDELLLKSTDSLSLDYNVDYITNLEGLIYIESVDDGYIIEIDGKKYEINADFRAIYDSSIPELHILSGSITEVDGNTIYQSGNTLVFEEKVIVKVTDRQVLSSNEYTSLIDHIGNVEELSDLNPPEIASLSHKDKEIVEQEEIDFSGKVEAGSIVTVNGEEVEVGENGEFTVKSKLKPGENSIETIVIDKSGNATVKKITITYKEPVKEVIVEKPTTATPTIPPQNTQPTNYSCNFGFSQQMLGLINSHRQANGKSTLSLNGAMNQAACNHSAWMNQNSNLSHTGLNGSQAWDRCASAGTSCNAENVAMHSSPTAQNLFNLWKNSPSHNANMLGNFSSIGIGLYGNYSATVFK